MFVKSSHDVGKCCSVRGALWLSLPVEVRVKRTRQGVGFAFLALGCDHRSKVTTLCPLQETIDVGGFSALVVGLALLPFAGAYEFLAISFLVTGDRTSF